jgi:hypothetical protein
MRKNSETTKSMRYNMEEGYEDGYVVDRRAQDRTMLSLLSMSSI